MPKSDPKFPFHFKIMQGVSELGERLFGKSRKLLSFIIELDNAGQIINQVSEVDNPDFIQLDENFKSFLMLDFIDNGEYIYIKWQGLPKEHIEKLLCIQFMEKDFLDTMGNTKQYASTGSIMF